MPFYKFLTLIVLSLVASYLLSKTVESSLKIRGLRERQIKFYKTLSFLVSFLLLLLLGLFS
ncbi:MAG: hypothetical protein DSZ31_01420 [Gammaproteobacteria bacterium]|nr:MAG: hypothetical protein DSZ31_01420 [Gammaproteobacteria bacterium]RTZ70780.1 MAG: hypothetical protein DSZ30_00220 [Aquificaceae bacterium]